MKSLTFIRNMNEVVCKKKHFKKFYVIYFLLLHYPYLHTQRNFRQRIWRYMTELLCHTLKTSCTFRTEFLLGLYFLAHFLCFKRTKYSHVTKWELQVDVWSGETGGCQSGASGGHVNQKFLHVDFCYVLKWQMQWGLFYCPLPYCLLFVAQCLYSVCFCFVFHTGSFTYWTYGHVP